MRPGAAVGLAVAVALGGLLAGCTGSPAAQEIHSGAGLPDAVDTVVTGDGAQATAAPAYQGENPDKLDQSQRQATHCQ